VCECYAQLVLWQQPFLNSRWLVLSQQQQQQQQQASVAAAVKHGSSLREFNAQHAL
jgi:hypothetical protein